MAQIKKVEVQQNILDAAYFLFSEKGYTATSMSDIAARAGITPGNIYRYHGSKFELFYDVLDPWLSRQFDRLETELALVRDARQRLRLVLTFLWVTLPHAENGFELNLMEALATRNSDEPYSRNLLELLEKRVVRLLEGSLRPDLTRRLSPLDLIHLLFMCHDGFVLNSRLVDESNKVDRMIDGFVSILTAA